MKWLQRISFVALAVWLLVLGRCASFDREEIDFHTDGFKTERYSSTESITLREVARYDIPMPADTPAAHASFLLADKTADGQDRLRAFWFAGSRESGEDVQILMSHFARKPEGTGVWNPPTVAVNRHVASKAVGNWNPFNSIRRIGNPVAWTDVQGRTHLYVVATTWLGGWAASRILHLVQATADGAFQPVGFLPLSPLFNISHLVRGTPIAMADGGVLLPAYFELGIKYPVAIRLDSNGELVQSRDAVVRMAGNLASLQPVLAVASQTVAIAYLRDNSDEKKLRFVRTVDGGKSWRDVPSSQGAVGEAGADFVINPDSSVATVRLNSGSWAVADGQTLLIHNPQTSGRHRLVIEASRDGLRGWHRLATLEYEPPTLEGVEFNEYSYPSAVVVKTKEGEQLHVSYTYQKRWIRHVILQIESAQGGKK
jgi:predicted neuraminidase